MLAEQLISKLVCSTESVQVRSLAKPGYIIFELPDEDLSLLTVNVHES